MNKKRVLLITRYFPPLDSIATLRMYSWAKYLEREGWSVSVITTSKERQAVKPLKLDISNFDVKEIDYIDPVVLTGYNKKQEVNKNFLQNHSKNIFAPLKKLLTTIYRERMNERMPGRTDPWILPAIKEIKKRKKNGINYDFVISSYGPPSAHIVGQKAAKIFNAYWIADYRDLWIEHHVYLGLFPFTVAEKFIEKQIVKHAHIITTVSKELQEVLQKKFYPIPVCVIENGFDPELMDKVDNHYYAKEDKKFRIIYTGSIYRGERDPSPLFQAVKELIFEKKIQRDHIEILFYGGNTGNLFELIKHYDLGSVVKHCGVVCLNSAYSIQKSADLLLFLEGANPKIDGILTGKLFEYLYSDVPVLAIGASSSSAPGRLICQTSAGVVCGTDVAFIKDSLLNFMQKNYKVKKNKSLIMQFTRENQVKRLIELMQ